MDFLKKNKLFLSWSISLVSMIGSLYFSEVKGFIPCTFCWYQRILMYPMVLLLGIAAFKKDYNIVKYTIPLSVLGMIIALIHYSEQKMGFISKQFGDVCSGAVPCGISYINYMGFITIPFLSLIGFTIIFILLSINKNKK
jgi:disulfide bond formation protein DsbB